MHVSVCDKCWRDGGLPGSRLTIRSCMFTTYVYMQLKAIAKNSEERYLSVRVTKVLSEGIDTMSRGTYLRFEDSCGTSHGRQRCRSAASWIVSGSTGSPPTRTGARTGVL